MITKIGDRRQTTGYRKINQLLIKSRTGIDLVIFCFIILFTAFNPICNKAFAQEEEVIAGTTIRDWLLSSLGPDPTGRRKIVLYEPTGLLVVTATATEHANIKELIDLWEKRAGKAQILIEARFIEVALADLADMGIEWQDIRYHTRKDRRPPLIPGGERGWDGSDFYVGPGIVVPGVGRRGPARTGTGFGIPLAGIGGGLGLFLGKTTLNRTQVQMYLHALQRLDKVNLISSPKLTTISGQTANIEIITRLPYATNVTRTNQGTAERPIWVDTYDIDEEIAGIIFEVTPTAVLDSMIINLDLHPEIRALIDRIPVVDSPEFPKELGWPIIDVRSIETSMSIRSGQTVVMGGLIKDDDIRTERKVPVLGNIPLLGSLFRYETQDRKKRNLVIFLTATLITPEGEPFEGH